VEAGSKLAHFDRQAQAEPTNDAADKAGEEHEGPALALASSPSVKVALRNLHLL
jgi:hypothetical protein